MRPQPIGAREGPTRDGAYGPSWRRTSRGLFVPAGVEATGHQRIFEVGLGLAPHAAISGRSALNFLGVNLVEAEPIDVVTPRNVRSGGGTRRHRRMLTSSEVIVRHSIRLTRPEVALFDAIAWEVDDRSAVAVADMALASEVVDASRMPQLLDAGRRHGQRVRRILALAEKRTRSPQETAMRLIWCLDLGLPRPKCNWPVRDPDGCLVGEADLISPGLGVVGEYDGAAHGSMRRRARDAAKLESYRRLGLEPFTLVGSDMHRPGLVKQRILGAIKQADPARARFLLERDPPWRP